jgi:hypothetical protein
VRQRRRQRRRRRRRPRPARRGGGTDYDYAEPAYQEAVVPAALAERNSASTEERNRVVPDISMDADPSTGLLIGETQEFSNGAYYDEFRLGGTSLSSPLFAGVVATPTRRREDRSASSTRCSTSSTRCPQPQAHSRTSYPAASRRWRASTSSTTSTRAKEQ